MSYKLFRLAVRIASLLAPARVARWAANLFFTPRRRSPGVAETLPAADHEYAVPGAYLRRWGRQGDAIFLLHGWEGRHTQFHALLPALRAAGHAVVTVDPPAHGRAPGTRANPRLFAEALLAAAAAEGQPLAVVGHSMGAGAAMYAVSQGLKPRALVLIAAPSNVRELIAGFIGMLGLGRRAAARLRAGIEQEVGLPLAALDVENLGLGPDRPPALVIHDRDDRRIPVAHAQTIARHWPNARLELSSGLGHRRVLADPKLVQLIPSYLRGRIRVPEAA